MLEVNNITKSYLIKKTGKGFFKTKIPKLILDQISLNIEAGEMLAILGKNGAGKSTLLKILTGIVAPDSGEIKFFGIKIGKNRSFIQDIGVVFGQKSQLWMHLPATDTFELHRNLFKIERKIFDKRIAYFKDVFSLQKIWEQPVRELSLGERMKCEVICALIHAPKMVFLDEPTIGFDLFAKKHFRDCMLQINEEMQTTVILTSHDATDIDALARRIVFLDAGKVILDIERKELISSLQIPRTLELRLREEIYDYSNDMQGRWLDSKTLLIELGNEEVEKRLTDVLKIVAGNLDDIKLSHPSMEDIIAHVYSVVQGNI